MLVRGGVLVRGESLVRYTTKAVESPRFNTVLRYRSDTAAAGAARNRAGRG